MTAPVQDAILLFGDSLTQYGFENESDGFAARMAAAYIRKLDVVNRGFSGYNTRWALPVFGECCGANATQNVRLLLIWFGANDAAEQPSVQHIPLPEYKANLKFLVAKARSTPCTARACILLITPPPVNEKQLLEGLGDTTRKANVTREYAKAVGDVVEEINQGIDKKRKKEERVVLVDVWTAIWKAAGNNEDDLRSFLSDGVHLTSKGYQIAHNTIMDAIQTEFPELYHKNLKERFPLWRDIDPTNPLS